MTVKLPFLPLQNLVDGGLYKVRVTSFDGRVQHVEAFCEIDVAGDEIRFVTGEGREINGFAIELSTSELSVPESSEG